MEPDPAQARPGHFRLRPRRTDPDDHNGGLTLIPGATIRWTGTTITREATTPPGTSDR
ncbi:hypothetical protein [Kitasatospora sp. NPDC088783]|uniref:hypothetical protein n=1 Tax=Kitasatospora sp. NPDC088783 TaxID=3364077 RepID=UPI00380D6B60